MYYYESRTAYMQRMRSIRRRSTALQALALVGMFIGFMALLILWLECKI